MDKFLDFLLSIFFTDSAQKKKFKDDILNTPKIIWIMIPIISFLCVCMRVSSFIAEINTNHEYDSINETLSTIESTTEENKDLWFSDLTEQFTETEPETTKKVIETTEVVETTMEIVETDPPTTEPPVTEPPTTDPPVTDPPVTEAPPVYVQPSQEYWINTDSGKYHSPNCHTIKNEDDPHWTIVTSTSEDLKDQGYSPCGVCCKYD